MEAQPTGHNRYELSEDASLQVETATAAATDTEKQETPVPEREITFEKLLARYTALGEQDTPELRAFIQREVDNEDRLWRENPEIAARRDRYRREFSAMVEDDIRDRHQ